MSYPKFPQLLEDVSYKDYEGAGLYLTRFFEVDLPVIFIGNAKQEEVFAICNINPDGEYMLNNFEFAVKDYGENEGVLNWLIKNGYLLEQHDSYPSGYVTIPICKSTDKLKELIANASKVWSDFIAE